MSLLLKFLNPVPIKQILEWHTFQLISFRPVPRILNVRLLTPFVVPLELAFNALDNPDNAKMLMLRLVIMSLANVCHVLKILIVHILDPLPSVEIPNVSQTVPLQAK